MSAATTRPLAGTRIGLLTASASRLGGGVAEAVIVQAAMIRALGGEAVIFALGDEYAEEDRPRYAPSEVHLFPVKGPAQVGYSPGLAKALIAAKLDLLHLHGIWMYPSLAGALWARKSGKPYVISPHGMLDPWITGRGRWKKALARAGYERSSWRAASFLHALTAREAHDIANESGRHDSVVIANAAPPASPATVAMRAPHVAYIGRIHSKKNLLALVSAWTSASLPAESRLTIAGWGDAADVEALQAAVGRAGKSVRFVGPIFGAAKQALLDGARFMVLPSLSEGLPMAVLEGWSAGAATIMTRECNLPDGFAAGAAIECGDDQASIADALERALHLGETEWLAMSRSARALAAGPFSAETIAMRWSEAYRQAMARGNKRG